MKIRFVLAFLFSGFISLAYSQNDSISEHGFKIPANLNRCVIELNKTFSLNAKAKLIRLNKDSLGYIRKVYIVDEWLDNNSSRLKNYFINNKIADEFDMEYFIYLSFYKKLKYGNSDISNEIHKYVFQQDSIEVANKRECERKIQLDTIENIYIPKNLNDCYLQLDKNLNNDTKQIINSFTNDSSLFNYDNGLDIEIFKKWHIYNCSRISKFFLDKNIKYNDGVGFIILVGYRHYLKGDIIDIAEIKSIVKQFEPKQVGIIKFKVPKIKLERNFRKFLKTKVIDNFEIGEYSFANK